LATFNSIAPIKPVVARRQHLPAGRKSEAANYKKNRAWQEECEIFNAIPTLKKAPAVKTTEACDFWCIELANQRPST